MRAVPASFSELLHILKQLDTRCTMLRAECYPDSGSARFLSRTASHFKAARHLMHDASRNFFYIIKRSAPGLAGPDRNARARKMQRRSRQRIIAAMSYQSDGVGNGQAGAAASTTAGENLTAILGGHTGTEAMHLRALTLLGLISSDGRSHKYTLLMMKGFFVS
jgi:hypothetical protein